MSLPRIGITLGDPGGIGPEIVVKALADGSSLPDARYLLFANAFVLEDQERSLGLKLDRTRVFIREVETPLRGLKQGAPDKGNGAASFLYFQIAVQAAQAGEIHSLVTAPVSKTSWSLAGISWRGHTEFLARLYPGAIMTFWSEKMTVALFSHHLPLREAVSKITRQNLVDFFRALYHGVERLKAGAHRFLVAGVNPHAGEDGLMGREEMDEILPAIEDARREGMNIDGPFPPDTVFRRALGRPGDIVVALYHDQGLIPFKLAAFDSGVNVTLGMPFIRTSPDHGPAYDIAGKNLADARSLREAIRLAFELAPRAL